MSLNLMAKTGESDNHGGDVESLLWHDGHVVSGGDDGKVKIWSEDLQLIREFQAHEYAIHHIGSDGKNLYTCSNDSTIREWARKGSEWKLARELKGHKHSVRKLRIHEGRLYSGDEAGEVLVWKDGEQEGAYNLNEEIWDMFVDKKKVYTGRDRDIVISEFGNNKGFWGFCLCQQGIQGNCTTFQTLGGRGPIYVTGDKLCFIEHTGINLMVHDNASKGNPFLGKLEGHSMIINAIVGNPDKFFTAGWDSKVVAWNLEKLSKITEVALDGYVNTMAMSSTGNLYVGGVNGGISALKINF